MKGPKQTKKRRLIMRNKMSGLSDFAVLGRLNHVHYRAPDNLSCLNPPLGSGGLSEATGDVANKLPQEHTVVDTDVALAKQEPSAHCLRVPPLVCRNKEGKRYTRPKPVQAQLRCIVPLDPSEWIPRAETLRNETLVC